MLVIKDMQKFKSQPEIRKYVIIDLLGVGCGAVCPIGGLGDINE